MQIASASCWKQPAHAVVRTHSEANPRDNAMRSIHQISSDAFIRGLHDFFEPTVALLRRSATVSAAVVEKLNTAMTPAIEVTIRDVLLSEKKVFCSRWIAMMGPSVKRPRAWSLPVGMSIRFALAWST